MEAKLKTLLLQAQAFLNLYHKGTPPADADAKMATLMDRVRRIREMGIAEMYPDLVAAIIDRTKDIAKARGWKDLD